MRESIQEEKTRAILEGNHNIVYRKDGRVGWPDRIALLGQGLHVWVEHKTEIGRLTPAQKRVFPKLRAAGDVIIYAKGLAAETVATHVILHANVLRQRNAKTPIGSL